MKRLSCGIILALLAAPGAFAQYTYFKIDTTMAGPPSSMWTTSNSFNTDMLAAPSTAGGEVRAVATGSGSFVIYLAATDCTPPCTASDGVTTNFTTGYQLGIASYGGISLSATNTVYSSPPVQSYYLGGGSGPALQAGTVIRAVVRADPAGGTDVIAYVNNVLSFFYHDTTTGLGPYGAIGFNFQSGHAATYVSEGDAGNLYSSTPTAVSSITPSAGTNYVDLQWPAASEPNGPGVYGYQIYRNGQLLTTTPITSLSYQDLTAQPSSTYTYTVQAIDFHWNTASTSVTVNTTLIPTHGPYPSAMPDGFRTGVKPTGTYWGAGNENIDVMSGNLSFSLPLLKAQARSGWSVPFKLSYNSQNWKQASGAQWVLGGDVGVGFGWRLMAGSITPVVVGSTVSMYIFTDATGAEYRLDQNSGSIWSSKESIYVYFDSNADVLHFRDGSFWTMGCISTANEYDSGVMYPTVMEDTNGNQILVSYHNGAGANWPNSSSRINVIQDVRSSSSTYAFTYNSDSPIPHLTSITNNISSGEQYSFTYAENQPIASPISGQGSGSTTYLSTATVNGIGIVTTFSYNGSGEMTQAVLPYGGYVKWDYDTVLYSGGTSYREVSHRYLSKDGTTGSQTTYTFGHESSVTTPIHQFTTINDPGGGGQKYWAFGQSGVGMGLVTTYNGNQLPGPVTKTQNAFTWSQDSIGNSYISMTVNTLDPGQSYQAQSQTTQTVDTFGNVLQVNNYNYGNLSSPARTYNYTYLNSSQYTSLYILNRLATASVTVGSTTTPLASNSYDAGFSTVTNPNYNWDTNYASVTARGNLTRSAAVNNTTYYSYNQLGVATNVSPNGVGVSLTTSNSNSYAAPSQLSVGSLTSSMTWSSFLGLTNDTGPNGDSSSTYYDSYARPSNSTSPFGATTTYTFSSAPYTSSNPSTVTTTTNGRWTKTTKDGLGRIVLVQSGDSSSTKSQVETVYNSCGCSPTGKMTQQAMPHLTTVSPTYTTYSYDGIGRTASVLAPDGASATTYSYQGNVVTVTDPAGKSKTFTMDAFGNLTQVSEPNPAGGSNYVTTYTYDVMNNLTQVSMPRPSGTQTRTFVYNGKLLTSATNPENGTVNYTYNSYNKVATKTDAKGQAVVYTYDSMARLTKVQRYPQGQSNSEDTCQQENYTYDGNAVNPSYSRYVAGRLATVQYFAPSGTAGATAACGTSVTEQFSYNQAGAKTNKGMLINRTIQYQGPGNNAPILQNPSTADLESSYTYDNEGRMLSVQYPGSTGAPGPDLGYAYDTMGRLSTMTDLAASATIISGTTYDPANRLLSIAGSYAESRTYNVMGQLTNLSNNSVNFTYSYSATQNNGKITGQTDNISGEQVVYAYDALNRLASAGATNSSWGESYTFDGFGNLTDRTVTAGSVSPLHVVYNASNNLQTTDCADANGNIIGPSSFGSCTIAQTYTYDVSNRLAVANGSIDNGGTMYGYAPGNKRIWKGAVTQNNNTGGYNLSLDVLTFWSITGQKLGDYNLSGDPSVVYQWNGIGAIPTLTFATSVTNYYFGGKQIAKFPAGQYSPTYVGSDRLGSMGKYYPWGPEKPSATGNNTEKFTAYFRDSETGLDYAVNRYHQPGLGRFLSADPFGGSASLTNPGSMNRYAYVMGDPINGTDPSGTTLVSTIDGCFWYGSCGGTPSNPAGGGGGGFINNNYSISGNDNGYSTYVSSLDTTYQALNIADTANSLVTQGQLSLASVIAASNPNVVATLQAPATSDPTYNAFATLASFLGLDPTQAYQVNAMQVGVSTSIQVINPATQAPYQTGDLLINPADIGVADPISSLLHGTGNPSWYVGLDSGATHLVDLTTPSQNGFFQPGLQFHIDAYDPTASVVGFLLHQGLEVIPGVGVLGNPITISCSVFGGCP